MEGESTFISKRKCRRHYGTSFCAVFDKKKHDESDSYISRTEGIKRARGQMDWLLKKGQDLPTLQKAHAVTHLFENFFPGERRLMTLRLLSSDIDKAPTRDIDEVCIHHRATNTKCWHLLCRGYTLLPRLTSNWVSFPRNIGRSCSPHRDNYITDSIMWSRSLFNLPWNFRCKSTEKLMEAWRLNTSNTHMCLLLHRWYLRDS